MCDKRDACTDNTTRQKAEPPQRKYNKALINYCTPHHVLQWGVHEGYNYVILQSTKSYSSRAQSTNTVGVAGVSYELIFRFTVADPEL